MSHKRSYMVDDPSMDRKQHSLDIMLSSDGSLIKTTNSTSNSPQSLQQQSRGNITEKRPSRLDAHDKFDFGPVHRCCQIFNVLVPYNTQYNYCLIN